MKKIALNQTSNSNNTNFDLFKKFQISDSKKRFLKGGSDIIGDDVTDV